MKKRIKIEGMSCRNCARHVEEALRGIPGVEDVLVNLRDKEAVAEVNENVIDKSLEQAIEEAGYIVTGIM